MLFKFKSTATADLIMLEADGRRLLNILLGEAPVKGIVQWANMPAAIEARYGGYADAVMLQISADDDFEALGECVRAIQKIPSRFKSYRTSWD